MSSPDADQDPTPEWMKRVKKDEIDLILKYVFLSATYCRSTLEQRLVPCRSSAVYAIRGYAPDLEIERLKLEQKSQPTLDKGWFESPVSQ